MQVSDHDWQAPGAPAPRSNGTDAAEPAPDGGTVPPVPPPGPVAAPPPPPVPPAYPAPTGQPAYGQPVYGQPAYGQPVYGPSYAAPGTYPAGGWTPPPKPGLLPLRPLGFGTLLWAPFRTLRRNPAATFGSGLVVQLVSVVATAAVFVPFLLYTFSRVEGASSTDVDAILSGSIGALLLLFLVPVGISLVASAFLQGVMVVDLATGTVGDRLGFAALWRRAAKRIGPLIGWTLLIALALVVGVAFLVLIVVLAASVSTTGLVVGIVIAVLLGLGLAALGAWIGVKLSLVPSVIVLEHAGIRQAVARSWRLTDGYFWRTFGVLLLVGVILNFAAQVVVQPVSIVGTLLGVIIDPTGAGAYLTITIITTVVTTVLSLLIGAITAVVQAALVAVIYIDLRMRKEGLDLELQRFVERRDAGQPSDDPYRAPAATAPTAGSEQPATWS
jgi:membrane-anchored glycerophosphoryl diester phosphodiesterase (GDPDase)